MGSGPLKCHRLRFLLGRELLVEDCCRQIPMKQRSWCAETARYALSLERFWDARTSEIAIRLFD